MENSKEAVGDKPSAGGESPSSQSLAEAGSDAAAGPPPSRTPFTSLSQEDADLALARTLQDQERAYMMLRMGMGDGSDYGSSESGSFVYEEDRVEDDDGANEEDGDDADDGEDAFDVHALAEDDVGSDEVGVDIDPSTFDSDEAYARALQEAEEQEVAVRLMALARLSDWQRVEAEEERGSTSRNAWQDVDPDELSYEELIALGEVVGTENRGLSVDKIASLPSVTYKAQKSQDGNTDQCVVCRLDYEDGENLVILPCKHLYHSECINNWLQINKVCPVCSTEVSVSENC